MTPAQARKLNLLRETHHINVCHFPAGLAGKQYKFYVVRFDQVLWNPVSRNEEGKITGYKLFDTFEEGLKTALIEAQRFTTA